MPTPVLPYPTDVGESAGVLVSKLTGGDVPHGRAVHAAWHVVGYGLGQGLPDAAGPPTFASAPRLAESELAEHLRKACPPDAPPEPGRKGRPAGPQAAEAVPWALIVTTLLDLAQKWLSGRP